MMSEALPVCETCETRPFTKTVTFFEPGCNPWHLYTCEACAIPSAEYVQTLEPLATYKIR